MSTRYAILNRCKMNTLVAFILLALTLALASCNWFRDFDFERGARLTGGDPQVGRRQLAMHSCSSCHVIPGVPKADGRRGPSLAHWYGRRTFLSTVPNTPENMEKWLERPSHRKPGTTMPDLSISAQESRDMTAYLFSIN
jgi:cytochrome c